MITAPLASSTLTSQRKRLKKLTEKLQEKEINGDHIITDTELQNTNEGVIDFIVSETLSSETKSAQESNYPRTKSVANCGKARSSAYVMP